MALFKYYKLKEKVPKPDGPLSHYIPSSLILAANKELSRLAGSEHSEDVRPCVAREERILSFQQKSELK